MKKVKFEDTIQIPENLEVRQKGDYLLFPDEWSDERVIDVTKRLTRPQIENFIPIQKKFKPEKSDFDRVRKITGQESDDFGFFLGIASSTRIDSTRDKFTKPVLERFEKHYREGRTVLFMHDGNFGVGATYDAYIEEADDSEYELFVKFYILPKAKTPANIEVKQALDTGIYTRLSVAFRAKVTAYIDSEQSTDGQGYWVFGEPDSLITKEVSIVDMGANLDAVLKSGKSSSDEPHTFDPIIIKDSKMKLKEVTLKSLDDKTIEVGENYVDAIKQIDTALGNLQKQLKKYEDAEAEKLKALKDDYIAKFNQLNPEATEAEKTRAKELSEALPEKLLKEDVENMNLRIQSQKTSGNLDTTVKEKEKDSDGGNEDPRLAYLN